MTRSGTLVSRGLMTVALLAGLSAAVGPIPVSAQPIPQIAVGGCADGLATKGFHNPDHNIRRGYPDRSVNLRADPHWREAAPVASMLCVGSPAAKSLGAYRTQMREPVKPGLRYGVGDATSQIPNFGYVNYILHNYYPAKNNPALTDPRRASAIVQAAIWYFTDKFVQWRDDDRNGRIDPDDAINGPASRIVADALAHGPLEPKKPAPRLTVNGPRAAAPGKVAGPYSVAGTSGPATVTVTGARAFKDAAGTRSLPTSFPLAVGEQFFLAADVSVTATIAVSAPVAVDIGNLLLSAAADLTLALTQALTLTQAGLVTLTAQLDVVIGVVGSLLSTCDSCAACVSCEVCGEDCAIPELFSAEGDSSSPLADVEGSADEPFSSQPPTTTPPPPPPPGGPPGGPPGENLAITGAPVNALFGLAVILLGLGLLAVRHRRRRRVNQ